ncbi:hypothetical protein R5R35_000607 [Gryllus longicercus]|uniref:Kinesin motor domain-containing protein n=1 Tax=Gryllus longicercus TaxID=2509291 RepID=A0AAN9Z8J0_9ORTH
MAECQVSVQVALRVRPLVDAEVQRGCQMGLECAPDAPQVVVRGAEKAFSFNYVFGPDVDNERVYETAVKELVRHVFHGYNVTVLAYGQTGSGKTYSMGTSYSEDGSRGVIPRVVDDLFRSVTDAGDREFKITVSFMELYQEQVFDLLDPHKSSVDIREHAKGVVVPGLTEVSVHNPEETFQCLIRGSLGRTTGTTAMNTLSSRSHAIFTITVHQKSKVDQTDCKTSKFHLVDLAGSERSKKTKTSGETFKEGININRSLFALGNVISALGEECQKGHISYRDSKLTRLLQDSLGGNSMTLMIACVSPADYNLDETLSTLRYADRAKRIRNKPVVNQDPTVAHVTKLRQQIREVQIIIQNSKNAIQCPHMQLQADKNCFANKNIKLAELLNAIYFWNCILEEHIHYSHVFNKCLKTELKEINSAYDLLIKNITQIIDSNTDQENLRGKFKCFHDIQEKLNELQAEDYLNTELIVNQKSFDQKAESQSDIVANACSLHCKNVRIMDDNELEETIKQCIDICKEFVMKNKVLTFKQKLTDELKSKLNQRYDLSKDHKCIMKNLVSQVQALKKQKEELKCSLQKIKCSATSPNKEHQLAFHKDKIRELQGRVLFLLKKISELNAIIKRKEKEEQKIRVLNNELFLMKEKNNVLVKQRRNTNNQFQNMKLQSERELTKLVKLNDKAQKEVNVKEMQHEKEQKAWKRKLEEAFAVSKRLKNALDVAKSAQEKHKNRDATSKLHTWLPQELDIMCHKKDAEKSLHDLVEGNIEINQHITTLSNYLSSTTISDGQKNAAEEDLKQLTDIVSARNAQISELQQKIHDSDTENSSQTRWDSIQSLPEAKHALKYLMNTILDDRRDILHTEKKCKNVLSDIKLKEAIICDNKRRIMEENREHQQRVTCLKKENEGMIIFLKHSPELNNTKNHEETLNQMSEWERRCDQLEVKLEQEGSEHQQSSLKSETLVAPTNNSDDVNVDDSDKPFWQTTPVFKRVHKLKSCKSDKEKESLSNYTLDGSQSTKRMKKYFSHGTFSSHECKRGLSCIVHNKPEVENIQNGNSALDEVRPDKFRKSHCFNIKCLVGILSKMNDSIVETGNTSKDCKKDVQTIIQDPKTLESS